MLRHLTYSRVVSTLALFIALGGTAFAITLAKNSVKSRHIAPGAVKTPDLGANAATGRKVNESTLGQVPRAAAAGHASRADSAALADQAAHADAATVADSADRLDGLEAAAFERSSRIQFGMANNAATDEQVIFTWPEMGLAVLNDGDADVSDTEIRLRNTRSIGSGELIFTLRGQTGASTLMPGETSSPMPTLTDAGDGLLIQDRTLPSRALLLECGYGENGAGLLNQILCWGTRSSP